SKAFRFYVIEPNQFVLNNSINETRDAIFDENRFSSVSSLSLRIPNGTEDIGVSKVSNEVPSGVTEEVIDEDVALWKEAINNEMDSIMGNNTWVLVDLPPGFRQKSGIDYFDTYGPIAFLNGELDEEVYMNQRWGFTMPDNEANVCKLIKSLYRLKQARKQWHQKFDEVVLSSGYLLNQADKCVDLTEEFLSSRFSIKDMREADVILVSTPMDTSEKFRPNNGQAVSKLEYTSNPSTQHWLAIHRVLKYLKKIMDYSLSYTGYPLVLEEYTDASWISNTKDNSSTNGWVFLLEGGAISWPSKKQTCTASLIIESEFVALAAAGKEAEWLKNLILEIPLWYKPIAPISIHFNSATTLAKAYSQMYNGKSRHLGIRNNMIRELIMNEVVSIEFVRS
ncbi:zinc finger, CCHC-type containing protein, partial [Tanacetum coccineum]